MATKLNRWFVQVQTIEGWTNLRKTSDGDTLWVFARDNKTAARLAGVSLADLIGGRPFRVIGPS
jgi:hypothetical protein